MENSTKSSGLEQISVSKHVPKSIEKPIILQNQTSIRKCSASYCSDVIPKRHIFTFMGCLATMITVSLHSNLSLAIVSMVDRSNDSLTQVKSSNECVSNISPDEKFEEKVHLKGEFYWNPGTEGLALGAVYYGQIVGSFPVGRLSELYGGKRMIITFILLASVFTMLTPMAARTSIYIFIACRFLVGIGTVSVAPIFCHLITRWTPEIERSFTSTIILFGGYGLGGFFTFLTAGLLCASNFLGGWPSVFYLYGIIGIVWCSLCSILMFETPHAHPTISPKELDYITKNLDITKHKKIEKIPWKSIMFSAPFWTLAVGLFGQYWALGFFITVQPLYMGTILNLDSKTNGILSSLPEIIRMFVACAVGYSVDRAHEKGYVTKEFIRKGATLFNSLLTCFGFIGIMLSGCDPTLNAIFFIIGGSANSLMSFGTSIAATDIAPNLSGTISGILIIFGTIPYFCIPAVVGLFTKYERSMVQWHYVYYCSIGIVMTSSIIYVIFGTFDPQPWGTDDDKAEEKDVQTRL